MSVSGSTTPVYNHGAEKRMTFTATVEQAKDGIHTATLIGSEYSVLGLGDTRDGALEDLRNGISYLEGQGYQFQCSPVEVVSFETV